MIYLDYVKKMDNGYIVNFFADKEEDILTVSDGKPFVTNSRDVKSLGGFI